MRILLALDGSPCSRAALEELLSRGWPEGSEVEVLSVGHAIPFVPDPFLLGAAIHYDSLEAEQKHAREIVARAAEKIAESAPDLEVTTKVLDGSPKELIVEEATRWGADLVILGSHGRGAVKRLFLGSVAHAAALHVPCSVHIVRQRA